MVERHPTREAHPLWLAGSDRLAGDMFYHRPGVVAHLCLAADRQTTFVFTDDLPATIERAKEMAGV